MIVVPYDAVIDIFRSSFESRFIGAGRHVSRWIDARQIEKPARRSVTSIGSLRCRVWKLDLQTI